MKTPCLGTPSKNFRYTAVAKGVSLRPLGSRGYAIHMDSLSFSHSPNAPFGVHHETLIPIFRSEAMEFLFRRGQFQGHPQASENLEGGDFCTVEFALEQVLADRREGRNSLGPSRPAVVDGNDVHQFMYPFTYFRRVWDR